jgi:hypothetical protein
MKIDLTDEEISELRELISWEQEKISDDVYSNSMTKREAKKKNAFWDKVWNKLGEEK